MVLESLHQLRFRVAVQRMGARFGFGLLLCISIDLRMVDTRRVLTTQETKRLLQSLQRAKNLQHESLRIGWTPRNRTHGPRIGLVRLFPAIPTTFHKALGRAHFPKVVNNAPISISFTSTLTSLIS